MPSLKDMFIIETNGYTNNSLNSVNKLPGILLGPQALVDFIWPMSNCISLLSTGVKNMLLLLGSPKNDENDFFDLGILASIADPILVKKSLKELAMPMSEVWTCPFEMARFVNFTKAGKNSFLESHFQFYKNQVGDT